MAENTNHDQHHGHGDHNPQVSHERRDIDVFQITSFGVGLLIAFLVSVGAMWALFDYFAAREDAKNASNPAAAMMREKSKLPPEPRLQERPQVELKDLRADEDAILNGYGWVDPAKNIVRIPIDEAIELVAKRGLPYKPSPTGSDNDGFRMIPEDSSGGKTLEKISQ
jgi:hypothetical protein